jgi:hypothetical protein
MRSLGPTDSHWNWPPVGGPAQTSGAGTVHMQSRCGHCRHLMRARRSAGRIRSSGPVITPVQPGDPDVANPIAHPPAEGNAIAIVTGAGAADRRPGHSAEAARRLDQPGVGAAPRVNSTTDRGRTKRLPGHLCGGLIDFSSARAAKSSDHQGRLQRIVVQTCQARVLAGEPGIYRG